MPFTGRPPHIRGLEAPGWESANLAPPASPGLSDHSSPLSRAFCVPLGWLLAASCGTCWHECTARVAAGRSGILAAIGCAENQWKRLIRVQPGEPRSQLIQYRRDIDASPRPVEPTSRRWIGPPVCGAEWSDSVATPRVLRCAHT